MGRSRAKFLASDLEGVAGSLLPLLKAFLSSIKPPKMTTRTPGTGGTNQATTLEAGLIADIRRAQSLERDSVRNPNGVNRIQSSSDDDTATFSAQISFPITLTADSNGKTVFEGMDYFSTPDGGEAHYTPGTGGTIKSTTIQGAIIEQTMLLKKAEIDPSKNPGNANCITWSISNGVVGGIGHGTFDATYTNMPLEIILNSDGGQTTTGKAYLL